MSDLLSAFYFMWPMLIAAVYLLLSAVRRDPAAKGWLRKRCELWLKVQICWFFAGGFLLMLTDPPHVN